MIPHKQIYENLEDWREFIDDHWFLKHCKSTRNFYFTFLRTVEQMEEMKRVQREWERDFDRKRAFSEELDNLTMEALWTEKTAANTRVRAWRKTVSASDGMGPAREYAPPRTPPPRSRVQKREVPPSPTPLPRKRKRGPDAAPDKLHLDHPGRGLAPPDKACAEPPTALSTLPPAEGPIARRTRSRTAARVPAD